MEVEELIREYLESAKTRMMQIATSVNDQPWCATVYYAVNEKLELIWISTPDKRHSQEITKNTHVAGVVVYDQQPPQPAVRGVQFEGTARVLSGDQEAQAAAHYVQQLGREDALLDDIRSGKNKHKVFKVTVSKFVLFDSQNFPENPRQEWQL